MNKCKREAKDLVAAGECEGGCVDHGGHAGKCELVQVTGAAGMNFGKFSYCKTAQKIDSERGLCVEVVSEQINNDTSSEDIDRDWLNENFVREPYCWALPIAGYYISETTTGYYRGRFDVFGVEDNGDETTYGQVARKGELANMLKLIAAKEAIREIRDNVLNERNQLAEAGFDSDKVNAVLGIIDDATSGLKL